MGTAGVALLRGSPAAQKERRAKARAEQAERQRTTGYAGRAPELGHVVAFELRQLGYPDAIAAFGGNLCAVGGQWNFQGNPRLAELMGRSLRSAQRYRARLEADGLLRSFCLEPGDMLEGHRCPVTRPQVVRDLSKLRDLAGDRLERLAARWSPPQRRPSKAEARRRARARARAAALVAPSPGPPVTTIDQLQDVAARAPEWLRGAILGKVPASSGRSGQLAVAPLEDGRSSVAPELTADELDAIDAELQELTEKLERERARPPPPD